RFKGADDSIDLSVTALDRTAGVHNEIGVAAFFFILHLPRDEFFKLFGRHSGPRQYAPALNVGAGRHDDDGVDHVPGLGLQEKWDFKHRQLRPAPMFGAQKFALTLTHARVDDPFQFGEPVRLAHENARQFLAIDLAVANGAWKCRLDHGRHWTFIEPVDLRIGIEHGDAALTEALGRRRFAHADRACETDD